MKEKQMIGIEFIEDIDMARAQSNALGQLEERILDSPEYKLLYGKTQMFYDDSGRSRGGHSYNIGQTSGSMAGKAFEKLYGHRKNENPELYELNKVIQETVGRIMGYSHDLGHTPLGHDGESVLDEKLSLLTEDNPKLKVEVSASRAEAFKGVKVVATEEDEKKSLGVLKQGKEYEYEFFQAATRGKEKKEDGTGYQESTKKGKHGIGYEHNEYSAQIFSRILNGLKEDADNGVMNKAEAEAVKQIDETRYVTAILAHSRSRFPSIPKDFLAQIVRQADKVEYMNYDYEEYAIMGFFPMERTEENAEQHAAFMSRVESRAKALGVSTEELLEYLQMSGYDRRMSLEERMIEEAIEGIDGKAPKGMIDDKMEAMNMAKICAMFKDDALFYMPDDGKRGLITGNNVERQEVILDKLLQYYFDNPDKIPNEKVVTQLNKLNSREGLDLISDGEEIVSYDPEKIAASNIYDRLKTYLSTLTNEQCETLYQQLVRQRIELGKGHGIEPVTRAEVDARIEKAKAETEDPNKKTPYSIEKSKEVFAYMPKQMKERIQQNRERHSKEVEEDQKLHEEMLEADLARQSRESTETPALLASTVATSQEIVTSQDIKEMAEIVNERSNERSVSPEDIQKNNETEGR